VQFIRERATYRKNFQANGVAAAATTAHPFLIRYCPTTKIKKQNILENIE